MNFKKKLHLIPSVQFLLFQTNDQISSKITLSNLKKTFKTFRRLDLRRDPGKPGKPLDDGLKPGGSGEIWGIGSEEGGSGTCGLGPGNME